MQISSKKYDVFFSYNWQDRGSVELVASELEKFGIKIFIDRWYLVPGHPWQPALENVLGSCSAIVVFIGPHSMGSWQQREMFFALDRQAHDPNLSVIPVILPSAEPALGFLSMNTWVDFRAGLNDPIQLAVLVAAVRGEPLEQHIQEKVDEIQADLCPYRGLRPFREEDADFFVGRETFTERLFEAVIQRNFIGVVGPSGCGKSSVVRAGLLPRLRRPNERRIVWDIISIVPSYHPLNSLAASLIHFFDPDITEVDRLAEINKLGEYLVNGRVSLGNVITRVLSHQQGTDRLLLFVDQWEELYTLCHSEVERGAFIEQLLQATRESALSVVFTLRGDFFGHVLNDRPLADELQGAVVNIGPMTVEELKQAINAPAQKVKLAFESGLINRILHDVQSEPGNLPLLEFVLTLLWEVKQGHQMLHRDYEAIGELQGAIACRAEDVYGKLSTQERKAAQAIFLQLVRPGEGTDDTRRRATFTDIGEDARGVALKLADSRLIVTGRDDASGEETLEVSHEALLHSWTRLQDWISGDREFLLWHQRLRLALEEWERTNKDSGALLRGAPLTEAERWLNERPDNIGLTEVEYIKESSLTQSEERRARERLRRRVTLTSAALAISFLIVATIAAIQLARSRKTLALVRQDIGRLEVLNDGQRDITWKLYPRPAGQADETINQWNILTKLDSAVASGRVGDPPAEVKGGSYWLALFSSDDSRPQVIPIRAGGYSQYSEPLKISTASFPTQQQLKEGMVAVEGDKGFTLNPKADEGGLLAYNLKESLHFILHPFYVDKARVTREELVAFSKSTGWQLTAKEGKILVSSNDAHAYCMWKRKRLLTAAEVIQIYRTQANIFVYTAHGEFEEIKNSDNTMYVDGRDSGKELIWDWNGNWLEKDGILGPPSGSVRGNYCFVGEVSEPNKNWGLEFYWKGGETTESAVEDNWFRCGYSQYDSDYVTNSK